MQTRVLKADNDRNLLKAADLVRQGKLVAFPTETVYGLGADATNSKAVAEIFAVKMRPAFDPLIVHIADTAMLSGVVGAIPPVTERLIEAFWPGPLTLILPKGEKIPGVVTSGLPTVAVRMPSNETALALIRKSGVPIAAPSANCFGRPSPTTAAHVVEDLGGKIPLVLDGGPTKIGIESTVLALTSDPPVILRPGGVSRESLEGFLGKISVSSEAESTGLTSPGQMSQHYAPEAKVLLFEGADRKRVVEAMIERAMELQGAGKVGVMLPEEEVRHFSSENLVAIGLGSSTSLDAAASRLFETLRAFDRKGVKYILALAPPKQGIGLAVFDRLFKAAGSQVTKVE